MQYFYQMKIKSPRFFTRECVGINQNTITMIHQNSQQKAFQKRSTDVSRSTPSPDRDNRFFGKPHVVISVEDIEWVRTKWKQPSVVALWLDCWQSDPYGSRWMQLSSSLGKSAFSEAKKVLSEAGLFSFKRDTSIRDGRETVCWMVLNHHGSRQREFWQSASVESDRTESASAVCKSASAVGKSASVYTTSALTNNTSASVDAIYSETLTQQEFQKPSVSYSVSFQDPPQYRARTAASHPEEELGNFEEEREEAGQKEIDWDAIATSLESKIKQTEREYFEQSVEKKIEEAPPPKSFVQPAHNAARTDDDLLQWVIQQKIPSMTFDEPPRNIPQYARAMLRRDGDELRREWEAFCELTDRIADAELIEQQCREKVASWTALSRHCVVMNYATDRGNFSRKSLFIKLIFDCDRIIKAEEFLAMELPVLPDENEIAAARKKASDFVANIAKKMEEQKLRRKSERLSNFLS